MKREEVWRSVERTLRDGFGRLLDIRDVRRVRRVAGDAWVVTVVIAAPSADVHVADINVDDAGNITPMLTADDIIAAARREQAPPASTAIDELADFGLDADAKRDDSDPMLFAMLEEAGEPIDVRVANAMERGDRDSLNEARNLLPQLLSEHERQGKTLFMMAEVEMRLGEKALAKGYLEAAAREFADRFDMESLEKAAAIALELDGREAFAGSPIAVLLEQSRARLNVLDQIFDARTFQGIEPGVRDSLASHITLRTLAPGETLVSEGEPSENVFVVKSGLVGVWLEKPSGGSWLVRCCFPGWLLGESSVIGPPESARCTATLKAERVSEVWVIAAEHVRAAMLADEAFGIRMRNTKQLHRIDSFFSMHETMSQLDVQVRDEMLSCIQRVETFDNEAMLLMANIVPDVALLVARGELALCEDGSDNRVATVGPDHFYGVRDAIHAIASGLSAIARPGTTVAFFDAARLQRLCERSPEQVVAVLERLG